MVPKKCFTVSTGSGRYFFSRAYYGTYVVYDVHDCYTNHVLLRKFRLDRNGLSVKVLDEIVKYILVNRFYESCFYEKDSPGSAV